MAKTIEILDTTLRDGAQGEGIAFSVQDKINIVKSLDELGIKYIEAGNPASNPKDMEFFKKARKLSLNSSNLVAFGSTRRKGMSCAEDENIQNLLTVVRLNYVYHFFLFATVFLGPLHVLALVFVF